MQYAEQKIPPSFCAMLLLNPGHSLRHAMFDVSGWMDMQQREALTNQRKQTG
jgi:hypothetical protein